MRLDLCEALEDALLPSMKKQPRRSGARFKSGKRSASRVGSQDTHLVISSTRPAKRRGLTTRLTDRTLHHLASLDQTEEGPVGKSETGGAFSLVPVVGR